MCPSNLLELIQLGGPAAVSMVLFFVWWLDRKAMRKLNQRNTELENKILEIAVAQAEASTRLEGTVSRLESTLNQLLSRIR